MEKKKEETPVLGETKKVHDSNIKKEEFVIDEKKILVEKVSKNEKVEPLTIEALFKSGAYFGHKKSRRNPKMDEYVYAYREGVAIIDVRLTMSRLKEALHFIDTIISSGKSILFVGTKKHVRSIVEEIADRTGMPFINNRWLGGTFTNFSVIRERVRYFLDLEEKIRRDDFSGYTKLEKLKKREEYDKMNEKIGGLRKMDSLPGVVFVLDVKQDHLAVKEANRAGIPVVALVDTNDTPHGVFRLIPANNDAISSIRFILEYIAQCVEKAGEKKSASQGRVNTETSLEKQSKK
ncbi:MAG: 30S ribosomal protein S2 [Candidatus Moranbacteria bacterium]|nr:30S ribosomal protein S2 [Candidatus Moranbacteria bacterium]